MATKKTMASVNAETQKLKASKLESVNKAIAGIEKIYGKGSVIKMDSTVSDFPHCSTGILPLDIALSIGGLPRGRIAEVYGPESSSKTSVCLSTIAECQRNGGIAAYIDAEHSLDPLLARTLGVNVEELLLSQPDTMEDCWGICESYVKSNAVDIVVVDSTNAMVSRAELEGEFGSAGMGIGARIISQAMRKLTGAISESNTLVILISQIRSKIGGYGNPEVIGIGNAVKFTASVRIDMRSIEKIKDGDTIIGNRVRAKIVKSKVGVPFTQAEFTQYYATGFDRVGAIVDAASDLGVIKKGGAWLSYEDNKWQGRDNAVEALKNNPSLLATIKDKTMEAHRQKLTDKRANQEADSDRGDDGEETET